MAHGSHYSNSPPLSPRSPSPTFSIRSDLPVGEHVPWSGGHYPNVSVSRGASPAHSDDVDVEGGIEDQEAVDSVICQWETCERPFSHLPTLINHIHNGTRRQLCFVLIKRTLISYIRSHRCSQIELYMRVGDMHPARNPTGFPVCSYIPHTCAHRGETVHMPTSWSATSMSTSVQFELDKLNPECDKSFTRSDAMAKHMRLQHNISTLPPGRGGNRKRKRDDGAGGESLPQCVITGKSSPSI